MERSSCSLDFGMLVLGGRDVIANGENWLTSLDVKLLCTYAYDWAVWTDQAVDIRAWIIMVKLKISFIYKCELNINESEISLYYTCVFTVYY